MNAVGGQWVQDTLAIPLTRILGCCRDADCMYVIACPHFCCIVLRFVYLNAARKADGFPWPPCQVFHALLDCCSGVLQIILPGT
jgi:hypothetical protein